MGQTAKPWWRAPAAGLMSVSLAALGACGGLGGPPSAGAVTAAATKAAASTPSVTLKGMPIYWVGESRRSLALYREFRTVPNKGGAVASAVSAMTRLKPLDPDYLTPWRPATRVRASQRGSAITVDLSKDAFANTNVGSELAALAVQQLVYTATAASRWAGATASTVKITVNGRAYDAWGVVRLGKPMRRAPMATVQAHTWIISPQQREVRRAGIVTFKGFGTSFEANFTWQVRKASGALVAKGFTTATQGNGGFGEFSFKVRLKAGAYVVVVSGGDASGGAEGPGAAVDDKAFKVC